MLANLTPQEREELILSTRKSECEVDGIYFCRYFFKNTFMTNMLVNAHHELMQRVLDRTLLPPKDPAHISRLVINVPPGFTKTEMAVINYAARGLAINPQSRYLHLSYSSNLAMQNSSRVRELVKSRPYQSMWPIQIKEDADSKSLWWTDSYGGMYATAAGAQVTGFRAGHMGTSRFTGALIVDDPTKPDDANFEVRREAINTRYNETIRSRLAVESVPIIVIMQRVHYNDLSGYLLRGGSGEKWHHLNLPVYMDNTVPYPDEYTHGIPVAHDLPNGWLWPDKLNEDHAKALRAHRRTYRAQYLQDPIKQNEEFVLWTSDMIQQAQALYNTLPPVQRTVVAVDPATSHTDNSDHHGVVVASSHENNTHYSIEADHTLKGSPKTWAKAAIQAYNDYHADAIVIETNQGGDMCEETLRNAEFKGRIIRVHASKGKVIRAEPIAALYEQGMVAHAPGLSKLETEMEDFDTSTGKSNGKSPNRLDAAVWGLTQLSTGVEMSRLLKLVVGGR